MRIRRFFKIEDVIGSALFSWLSAGIIMGMTLLVFHARKGSQLLFDATSGQLILAMSLLGWFGFLWFVYCVRSLKEGNDRIWKWLTLLIIGICWLMLTLVTFKYIIPY